MFLSETEYLRGDRSGEWPIKTSVFPGLWPARIASLLLIWEGSLGCAEDPVCDQPVASVNLDERGPPIPDNSEIDQSVS